MDWSAWKDAGFPALTPSDYGVVLATREPGPRGVDEAIAHERQGLLAKLADSRAGQARTEALYREADKAEAKAAKKIDTDPGAWEKASQHLLRMSADQMRWHDAVRQIEHKLAELDSPLHRAVVEKNKAGLSGLRERSKTVAKEATPCDCGCGGTTTSRYLPGHDAKHKSALIAQALDADSPAVRKKAADRLEALGWTKFLVRKREIAEAKALAANAREVKRAEQEKARVEAKAAKPKPKAAAKPKPKAAAKPKSGAQKKAEGEVVPDPKGSESKAA